MRNSVKALLFDLGGVVFDISFKRVIERWNEQSGVGSDILTARFTPDLAYEQHERGEIEAGEYYASLRKSLGVTLSDEQFEEGWNAVFLGEIVPTVKLLKQLEGKVPLYAFSNTNEVHKQFWSVEYAAALEPFKHIFVSSDIGKRKPEHDAFSYVASKMGVSLKEIMFFDDSEENTVASEELGMQAVLVNSPADVAKAVKPFLRGTP